MVSVTAVKIDIENIQNRAICVIQEDFVVTAKNALLPIIDSKNMEKHIRRVVDNLLKLKYMTISLKELSFGIEWLIVDKYVTDEEERNILCDLLGDKMSLIHEYGERKEQKGRLEGIEEGRLEGIKSIILKLYDSGLSVSEISERSGMSISDVNKIINIEKSI